MLLYDSFYKTKKKKIMKITYLSRKTLFFKIDHDKIISLLFDYVNSFKKLKMLIDFKQ